MQQRSLLARNPWLVTGIGAFLIGLYWGFLRARHEGLGLALAETTSSGIVFFLIGGAAAALGYFAISKRSDRERREFPLWALGVALYWLLAVATGLAFFGALGAARILFFPILYAPYFVTSLATFIVDGSHLVKSQAAYSAAVFAFHALFDIAFGLWLALELQEKRRLLRRAIIALLLVALLIGTLSCMRTAARIAID